MICKNTIARKIYLLTFALFLFAPFSLLSAQTITVEPKVINPPVRGVRPISRIVLDENITAERSIAVDDRVKVQLSVCEGKVKVNGWERNEIRAFVTGGRQIRFKIIQRGGENETPVWLEVVGFDPTKNNGTGAIECLSGKEIEIDVPRGATVNVKSNQSETTIDSVRKVTVKNAGGNIFLNRIAEGISAETYQGGVTVENSSGAMTLNTSTGNIVAFGVNSSEIGDVFRAKTSSGTILLQRIEHRQTEVTSASGSIKFVGNFQNGGQYTLRTHNGSILLALSEKSSFRLNASFGFGAFNSEIPLENVIKNVSPKAQSLTATVGKGESTLTTNTVSGAIRIKKQ